MRMRRKCREGGTAADRGDTTQQQAAHNSIAEISEKERLRNGGRLQGVRRGSDGCGTEAETQQQAKENPLDEAEQLIRDDSTLLISEHGKGKRSQRVRKCSDRRKLEDARGVETQLQSKDNSTAEVSQEGMIARRGRSRGLRRGRGDEREHQAKCNSIDKTERPGKNNLATREEEMEQQVKDSSTPDVLEMGKKTRRVRFLGERNGRRRTAVRGDEKKQHAKDNIVADISETGKKRKRGSQGASRGSSTKAGREDKNGQRAIGNPTNGLEELGGARVANEQPQSRPVTAKMKWKDRARNTINDKETRPLPSVAAQSSFDEPSIIPPPPRVFPCTEDRQSFRDVSQIPISHSKALKRKQSKAPFSWLDLPIPEEEEGIFGEDRGNEGREDVPDRGHRNKSVRGNGVSLGRRSWSGQSQSLQQIQYLRKSKIIIEKATRRQSRQQSLGVDPTSKAKRIQKLQRLRRQRVGILKRLKIWGAQTNFLQNAGEDERNEPHATELSFTMSEEEREAFVQSMVESCRKNADFRSSFLDSVKMLIDSGLMHSAASKLLLQGPCEEAQEVTKAWDKFGKQHATANGLPMDLLNAVNKLHENGKDLFGKIARSEDSSLCSLSRIHDGMWQIQLPNLSSKKKSKVHPRTE